MYSTFAISTLLGLLISLGALAQPLANDLTETTSAALDHADLPLSGFQDWVDKVQIHSDPKCRPVSELKKTWACIFINPWTADRTLSRAALWVEAKFGHPVNSLISPNSKDFMKRAAGGHNISSEDLNRFYKHVERACEQDVEFCFLEEEKYFFEKIFLPIKKVSPEGFYMITMTPSKAWKSVLSHELWHAFLYENLNFYQATKTFWKGLTKFQFNQISENLQRGQFYGPVDHILMDEFQAYCNMKNTKNFRPRLASMCLQYQLSLKAQKFVKPRIFNHF